MALSNLARRVSYQGNGSTTTFTITPDIMNDDSAEISVYLRDEATSSPAISLQTEGTDYTLTGASPPTTPFHNTVSFTTAPTTTDKIIIVRTLALTQVCDLIANGPLAAETLEQCLDNIVAHVQQLNETLDRSPTYGITNQDEAPVLPDAVADGILVYDSTGTNITTATAAQIAAASADPAGAYKPNSTVASPQAVTAAGGVTFTIGQQRALVFAQGSGGSVTITATNPLQSGTIIGQELTIIGQSALNTITIQQSGNTILNGDVDLSLNGIISFIWNGSSWVEAYRNA